MVRNLGSNSKFLVPVIVKLSARDPAFVELFLGSNQDKRRGEGIESTSWDVVTLVQKLYEEKSQDGYCISLSILTLEPML